MSTGGETYTLDLVPVDAIVGFVTIDDDPPTSEEVINDEIFTYEHCPSLRISKLRPFTHEGPVSSTIIQLMRY
jgi:hypothetical protein